MPYMPRYDRSGTFVGSEYLTTPPRATSTSACLTRICDSFQEVKYEIDQLGSYNNIHLVSVTAHKEQLLLVILYS
jgi:hypothetical protein